MRKQNPNDADNASGNLTAAASFLKLEARHAHRALLFSAVLSVISSLLLIGGAWLLATIVNDLIFSGSTSVPWMTIGLLIAAYAARAFLGYAADRLSFVGALAVKSHLRKEIAHHLFKISPLNHTRTGSLTNLYVEGIEALQNYYAQYLPARITTVFIPLAIIVITAPINTMSALIMAGTAPLIPFFMILIGRGAERLNQRQWRRLSFMSGHFLDLVQGLTTLKLFNASRREGRLLAQIGDDYRRDTMAVLRLAFLSSLVLEFFATVSVAVIAVLIGFRLLWGTMDFQHGFFILLLAPEFYLPLRRMGTHYHARMEAIAAAEQLSSLLNTPAMKDSGTITANTTPPTIVFKNVSYIYPDGRTGLDNISFTLTPGTRTALVGASGSGKSTILMLLLKFATPTTGRILVNNIDLATFSRDSWHQTLGWLPQRPRLFSGTVRENIGDATNIAELCRNLRIDWQEDLLDQNVTEAARNFSAGQIQRIALARALARAPALLLLDEPTASLDDVTERAIETALQNNNATQLVTAHRLATIRHASQILVIENGQLAACGTHDALLQTNAYYRECIEALRESEAA